MGWIEQLAEVDTDGVEPMTSVAADSPIAAISLFGVPPSVSGVVSASTR